MLERAVAGFGALVDAVPDGAWAAPTPCAGWTVRDLVGHVVVEDLWAVPLFAGRTVGDVGSALDGDQLGDDPRGRWAEAAAGVTRAAAAPAATTRDVHLSFGDVPGAEYAMQLLAEHLVHGHDLATALGVPFRPHPDDVAACLAWFEAHESAYRAAGLIGPRADTPADAEPLAGLLAAFGRSPSSDPAAVVTRFNEAFNRHDVDAVMALMTPDAVFEGTAPPDGDRYEGADTVRGAWLALFASSPQAHFTTEELVTCGDRVVVRWLYRWDGGHVRGIDLFRVCGGLVAEKRAYVKG
jgi:uncharacterized protein (TIGR03086 family)